MPSPNTEIERGVEDLFFCSENVVRETKYISGVH
jgi:hypothetical protein